MDKSITTGLMIIVSMVLAIMLFNVAYPAVIQGGDAITGMASRYEDQMRSQISIIHVTGELDETGTFRDTNSSGTFDVFVWVKNVGQTRLTALDNLDLFFGPEGNFIRIPHQSTAAPGAPYWTWQIEGNPTATDWQQTATLRITINFGGSSLQTGRYFVQVTTPTGISDDYFTGI